jgi:molecular chaperone GrpE
MPDQSANGPASNDVGQLANEVAELRDLFQRRLLDDRSKQQLYDELYRQLQFAQKGLVDQFIAPLVRELLLVLDRIDALRADSRSEQTDLLLESVRDELVEVLTRRGLRVVHADGERFDPSKHEAVGRIEVTDPDQVGQVIEVRRPGYVLEERLLRPAQVVVGYM